MHTVDTSRILLKNNILLLLLRVQFQKTCQILATVAIVRRRPNRHNIFVLEQLLIPLVHQLMRPSYQTEPIMMVEFVDNP